MEIAKVIEELKKGNAAFLCGAGVSFHSGIPIVTQLLRKIMSELGLDKENTELLLDSNLPFESYMESILEQTNVEDLYEVFKNTVPSRTHKFIAKCVAEFRNPLVVTTNFDTLLEDAIQKEEESAHRQLSVGVIRNIQNIDLSGNNPKVIKIHGSIDKIEELGITLSHVASEVLMEEKTRVLQNLLKSGSHELVLVFGYSCSDIFDLCPIIESLAGDSKQIVFIEHTFDDQLIIEDINKDITKNPFQSYSGIRIKVNTDELISELFIHLFNKCPSLTSLTTNWESKVELWGSQWKETDSKGHKISLLSFFFMKISRYDIAIPFIDEALEIFKLSNNFHIYYQRLQDRGLMFLNNGSYSNAERDIEESIGYFKSQNLKKQLCIALNNLGGVYERLDRIDDALNCYQQSIEIIEKSNTPDLSNLLGNRIGNIAKLHFLKKNFASSTQQLEIALKLAKLEGNVSLEASMQDLQNAIEVKLDNVWSGSGSINNSFKKYDDIGLDKRIIDTYFNKVERATRQRNYHLVERLLNEGDKLFKFNLGDRARLLSRRMLNYLSLNELDKASLLLPNIFSMKEKNDLNTLDRTLILDALAQYYTSKSDYMQAESIYEEAIQLCPLENREWKVILSMNRIEMLSEKGDLDQMYSLLRFTIPLAEEERDVKVLKTLYMRLGDYYNIHEQDMLALEYFEKALELSTQSEDEFYTAGILDALAKTCANLAMIEDAVRYWMKSAELARKTKQLELEYQVWACLEQFGISRK